MRLRERQFQQQLQHQPGLTELPVSLAMCFVLQTWRLVLPFVVLEVPQNGGINSTKTQLQHQPRVTEHPSVHGFENGGIDSTLNVLMRRVPS